VIGMSQYQARKACGNFGTLEMTGNWLVAFIVGRAPVRETTFHRESCSTSLIHRICRSCLQCNARASKDEEYFACLIECARVGSVSEETLEREKIKQVLREKPLLSSKLDKARRVSFFGHTSFSIDGERVRGVVVKLARGHAAFELNEPQYDEPSSVTFVPLCSIEEHRLSRFEEPPPLAVWPEVGSHAMQRLLVCTSDTPGLNFIAAEWIVVQPDRYRYLVRADAGTIVRIVVREYLACEVIWNY